MRKNLNALLKKTKQFAPYVYWGIFVVLAAIAILVALSGINTPFKIRVFSVQSGSMSPAIPTGSVVIVRPETDYKKGDVVTFKYSQDRESKNPKETVTHRIVEVKIIDSKVSYMTEGDANKSADPTPVDKDLVIGKVVLSIPLIGYPVGFARTLPGLILLIIIPATIIIYSELVNVKKEIGKLLKQRAKNKK
ncbi:MAG: signal peptidase I [Patescibacteria group bacterium]|nr:signal peptidase I [Patescibacteria group bacterium]MCL5431526.1 signal peptidase I [Patescibacteria group bacterium]